MREIIWIVGGVAIGWWVCSTKLENKELKKQNDTLSALEDEIKKIKEGK